MKSGELEPDLGPSEPHPDRRRDPGHRPGAAGRLQRRARHARPGGRPRDRRRAARGGRRASPGSVRSGCPARWGAARSRSTSTIPIGVPLAEVVAEIERLAAEHGARPVEAELVGLGARGGTRGLSGRACRSADFDPRRDVIENVLG